MPSFAILCIGRVGSEHLVSLLASHPDITCFSELFAPEWAVEPQHGTLGVSHFVRTGHERPATYWQELMKAAETPMVGLKLPWSSIEAHPETLELIRSPETRIVRLTREDRLAQYVSAWLALESGVWRSTQGAYRPRTIRVDPAKCLHALNVIDGQENHLDQLALGHPVFAMTYEELVAGERLDELQSFLGVEPRALTSRYERLRERSLPEVIENFDELVSALAETPFAIDREAA